MANATVRETVDQPENVTSQGEDDTSFQLGREWNFSGDQPFSYCLVISLELFILEQEN